jgi:hypothetical protein
MVPFHLSIVFELEGQILLENDTDIPPVLTTDVKFNDFII